MKVTPAEAGGRNSANAGINDPTTHFNGRIIRVRGMVIRKENRPYIEVDDPNQIELKK